MGPPCIILFPHYISIYKEVRTFTRGLFFSSLFTILIFSLQRQTELFFIFQYVLYNFRALKPFVLVTLRGIFGIENIKLMPILSDLRVEIPMKYFTSKVLYTPCSYNFLNLIVMYFFIRCWEYCVWLLH